MIVSFIDGGKMRKKKIIPATVRSVKGSSLGLKKMTSNNLDLQKEMKSSGNFTCMDIKNDFPNF